MHHSYWSRGYPHRHKYGDINIWANLLALISWVCCCFWDFSDHRWDNWSRIAKCKYGIKLKSEANNFLEFDSNIWFTRSILWSYIQQRRISFTVGCSSKHPKYLSDRRSSDETAKSKICHHIKLDLHTCQVQHIIWQDVSILKNKITLIIAHSKPCI